MIPTARAVQRVGRNEISLGTTKALSWHRASLQLHCAEISLVNLSWDNLWAPSPYCHPKAWDRLTFKGWTWWSFKVPSKPYNSVTSCAPSYLHITWLHTSSPHFQVLGDEILLPLEWGMELMLLWEEAGCPNGHLDTPLLSFLLILAFLKQRS